MRQSDWSYFTTMVQVNLNSTYGNINSQKSNLSILFVRSSQLLTITGKVANRINSCTFRPMIETNSNAIYVASSSALVSTTTDGNAREHWTWKVLKPNCPWSWGLSYTESMSWSHKKENTTVGMVCSSNANQMHIIIIIHTFTCNQECILYVPRILSICPFCKVHSTIWKLPIAWAFSNWCIDCQFLYAIA